MPKIELSTQINANRKVVFDLSRSVELHKISTSKTNEEAIAGKTSGLMDKNDWVTWKAKHLGFYQTLTSKITDMEYPNFFADEMVRGAFKSFRHEHYFQEKEVGLTVLKDVFKYESPLGVLGRIADRLFLEKYMRNFLYERNLVIKQFAESEKWKEIL